MSKKGKDVNLTVNGRSDKLPIRQFQFTKDDNCPGFVEHPSIIMIAKRGSGKSWIVRAILEHFRDIPAGIIISPTDRMSCFYGKFFPDTYIYYEFRSDAIERILNRQREIIDKEKRKLAEGKKIDSRAFIIMDDCLSQKGTWVRDQTVQELLFNGRHYKIMYILTMQFPLGITPELRSNFDYVFLLADDYISNMKRIYDHYAGMFPTFDSFRQVFSQLTSDHGSMVIVNRGVTPTLFDKIFYYKAPDLSNVSGAFGCKQFRDYHNNNYNKNWAIDKDRIANAEEYFMKKKKAKSRVVVDKIRDGDNAGITISGKKRQRK